ncbi:MAG: helix-turn-helix protein [Clostridia bacterium]|jgi:putative transcriptional regulator|nr:helix-turn-helix protein [Clostridia bacterium]
MAKKNLKLKELRQKDKVTQNEVAQLLGISKPAYNQKENGKRSFTVKECKKISDLFGEPIEVIFFAE